MKMSQIIGVKRVVDEMRQTKFASQTAYKLMKLSKAIDAENDFYIDKLKEIINEFGERDDDGNLVKDDDGVKICKTKFDECQRALAELNNIEVEKPSVSLTVEELEPALLSIADMDLLSIFFVET